MEKLKIQALERAFAIINLFTQELQNELSAKEIGDKLKLPSGTLYRFLSDLECAGYVTQDKKTKKYRLGLKLMELGSIVSSQIDLRKNAFPYLEELRVELNENVNLGILDGHELVYLERLENARLVRVNVRVGSRLPIHCTSIGKVLIAYETGERIQEIIEKTEFKRFTDFTITDKDEFMTEIARIKQQGYAISNREFSEDICTVAVPIFNSLGEIEAAVNVSAPYYRLTNEHIDNKIIPTVKKVGESISRSIGFNGAY
jgi:IclR family transcriptional regulator, KDG regulon repressor